jgi:hypothetical protein
MSIEILIIIFVIYSILNRFFGNDKKKKEELRRRKQQQATQPEEEEATDWEQAMKELETIFSGEPVQPEPVQTPEPAAVQESASTSSENAMAKEMERQRELADFSRKKSSLDAPPIMDENNPIYGAAAITTPDSSVEKKGTDYVSVFRNPDTLVKAIVIKEILDRPKSLRKNKAIF